MRALLATAGLLVLAGSAAAGSPSAHTLRKSPGGPIAAVAQDGNLVAWLAMDNRGCNVVHLSTPGKRDRTLPQPSTGTMTCHWDLSGGQTQMAVAAQASTALWTLHQGGPAPFDYVVAASVGGPERQIERIDHASTGEWLGGITGSGKTLAYSWDDVEYIDKLGCLSGGSCKQKIADGGIKLVTRTAVMPLPGAKPALGIAASAGRIAYIPATTAKSGRPLASANNSLYVVDATTGDPVSQASVHGIPAAIALSPHVLAVLTQRGPHDRISWFSPTGGKKLGSVLVSPGAAPQIVASDHMIVYRVGRLLRGIATHGGRMRTLTKTGNDYLGLSLANGRLVWAENRTDGTGRLRSLAVR